MRNRSFTINTAEVLVPVVLAVLTGLVLIVLIAPNLSFGFTGNSNSNLIRIYSSVPMNSFASIAHRAQMAFEEPGYTAGDFTLEYVPHDDARPENGDARGQTCTVKWAPHA